MEVAMEGWRDGGRWLTCADGKDTAVYAGIAL